LANLLTAGNVSYAVPGFHGVLAIPEKGVNHAHEFTAGAGSPEGLQRSLYCGAGMAVVACQILTDNEFSTRIKADFENEDA
jgi:hypothetical protein